MGVQGFTPFLQKTVPHIIHRLPNRLKDLVGKKIVLDGTLITQRLHFAPSPHPFRHVLGWYNLARELNENNIRAVCVFDGNLRAKAKALALGKREASRKLHASRGALESVRIKRLQQLKSVMANVRTLDEKGKSAVAEMLSKLNVGDGTGTVGTLQGLSRVGETLRVLSVAGTPSIEEVRPVEQEQKQTATPTIPTTPLIDERRQIEEEDAAVAPEAEPSHVEPPAVQEQPQDSRVIGFGTPTFGIPASASPAEDIKSVILNSYRDFRFSISKVASLSLPEKNIRVPASVIFDQTEEADAPEEDLVLSKTQCELTLEESKVWDELALATSPVVEPAPVPVEPAAPIPSLPTIPTSLEAPPASTPLEASSESDLSSPPSVDASLEHPPATTDPQLSPPTTAVPSVDPVPSETLPPPLEPSSPPAESPSLPLEPLSLPAEPPSTDAIPQDIGASETPLPPLESASSVTPVSEEVSPHPLESPPAAALPHAVPFPSETPPPPSEADAPPTAALPSAVPPPAETLSLPPETEITPIPASSELPSLPEAPPATLTIPTPPAEPTAEEPPPKPTSFALDHFVLSAAEDRLDALASRSEIVADSYHRRTYVPTKRTYMESREILEAMGIPCYEVEGEDEGEGVASSLVLQGMADYVVSEDTDVLVYGAPIIRNITNHGVPLTLIHGNDVREALDLSNDACIDFAILLGTDFSQRIRNVGPMRAFKLIKEHETIENILSNQTKHQPTIPEAQYMAQVHSARAIFGSPPAIPSQLRLAATCDELVDQAKVAVVMERCGLGRALVADSLWDYEAALDGNYFSDNPSMIVS